MGGIFSAICPEDNGPAKDTPVPKGDGIDEKLAADKAAGGAGAAVAAEADAPPA